MRLSDAIEQTVTAIDHLYGRAEAENVAKYYFEDRIGLTTPSYILSKSEMTMWERDLADLKAAKPLQYVTGVAHFYGHALLVDESVLIPRPETEELVHQVIRRAKEKQGPLRILDVGTGSGCIAISVKKALPSSTMITGIDVSERAIIKAIDNSQLLDAHVMMRAVDVFDDQQLTDLGTFDMVLANPPYIPPSEATLMPDHVKGYEPGLALFVPEDDPLKFYRRILEFKQLLEPSGDYFFEINEHFADELKGLALGVCPERPVQVLTDMQGKDRVMHLGPMA